MNETVNNLYPQLRLLEFRWDHGRQLVIPFSPGLVILHGKTQTHRTMVLRLIRYAMGASAGRIDENVMRASEEVELKFTANGELVRVVRSCQRPTGKFKVFDSEQRHEFTPAEMSEYLIDKLGLPKVYMSRSKRDGTRYEVPLSFNELARAIVVDRDISYASILSEVWDTPRKEIVKVMMGLTSREVADMENRFRALETRRTQLKQEIAAIRSFLTSLDVPTLLEIEERRQSLLSQLAEMDAQEDVIREQVRANTATNAPATEGGDVYETLRNELLSKRRELEAYKREILNLTHQQQEKTDLRSVLEAEARRINRHLSSQHVVSTYTFSQCPRCLQPIEQSMYNREVEGQCMLCGRSFDTRGQDIKAWEKALRDVNQTVNEVNQLLDHYQQRKDELQETTLVLEKRIQWLEQELSRETERYVSPLIEQIRLRTAERTTIERALSQLEYQERQRQYAIQLEEEALPQAERDLEEVTAKLETLRQKLGSASDRYNTFLTHFRYFMRNVSLVHRFEGASWNEKEQLPLINDQPYKKAVTGPDLVIAVLAFHYALLAMSVAEPEVRTNHPKLLMVDEPEQQKMGKERYRQVMELLGELALSHREQIQVIIATETHDIPPEFEQFAYEI